jgi:hypothetical protein
MPDRQAVRDPVRASYRHPMGAPAIGVGLRLEHDLQAPAGRNEADGWDPLHQVLLKELRSQNRLDWSRAVTDSSHVRAARRSPKADPARSTAHGRAASTT